MLLILWRYRVKAGRESEFEQVYGPCGDWTALFGQAAGFATTELLRDTSKPRSYLTIDRWASETAYHAFRQGRSEEYETLDERCAALTEREEFLGAFLSI